MACTTRKKNPSTRAKRGTTRQRERGDDLVEEGSCWNQRPNDKRELVDKKKDIFTGFQGF